MTPDDYVALLTGYHVNRPKFTETVSQSLQPLTDTQQLLSVLYEYFNLDPRLDASGFDLAFDESYGPDTIAGAVGVQLDIIGKWINLSRDVRLPLQHPWFSWDDEFRGWEVGVWAQPFDVGTHLSKLDDETYRRLLKSRIRASHWDGTPAHAQEILREYFIDETYTIMVEDKKTMAVFHTIAGRIPSILDLELFSGGYLPLTAAGVRTYHLVTTVNESSLFGFDMNNEFISGWDTGAWGAPPRYLIDHHLTS